MMRGNVVGKWSIRIGVFSLCLLCLPFCTKPKKDVSLQKEHPFDYDLHITRVQGHPKKVVLCCHGMGGDYRIVEYLQQASGLEATLVSFNFPDHGIRLGEFDPEKTSLGTVDELLAPLYVLKKVVVDEEVSEVSLYGFSAGGGALINMLAVLNTTTHDSRLQEIGIGTEEKAKILEAIQKGKVFLDAPLKSLDEMLAYHEPMHELDVISARYQANGLEPIENIGKLENLSLDIFVNFQVPDEVLSNRDDDLYLERLKEANSKGAVYSVSEGQGHGLPHPHLWTLLSQQ